jgi:hypothetical protein
VSLGPIITVQYICDVVASCQGYSKGSLGPLITVQYIGYLEFSSQVYIVWGVRGH